MTLPRAAVALALAAVLACRRPRAPDVANVPARFRALDAPGSQAVDVARPCARCHPRQYEAWRASQHALAQRPLARLPAPSPVRPAAEPVGAIGVTPLWQVLVAGARGRVQVLDPAWDPARREWFSVFADARSPGAWGHWTGRGMTWNAQCAACHTTAFTKGWDAARDAWDSAWSAAGVACEGCHGPQRDHPARVDVAWRAHLPDTCASCHARREELTGAFAPGARFDDHYALSVADTPGGWHPDGRAADEDFEFTSLAMSRMGHAGVTCLDCHDPHSGGLRAPVSRDQLCLTCHGAPTARGAPRIDVAHARHPVDSAGARCVACHMPEATFMQRDRRRDHGFTVPDPALARELGMPDVCAGCHADRPAGWTEQAFAATWGTPHARPSRTRARLVARARRRDEASLTELLRATTEEPVAAWRAALVASLAPWSNRDDVRAALARAARDPSPWVQSAALRALGDGEAPPALLALQRASTRSVRVAAAWAARGRPDADAEARRELDAWLAHTSDQPAGAMRRSELAWREGRRGEALAWAERAARWDASEVPLVALARVQEADGDVAGAVRSLTEAMRAAPESAGPPYARALVLSALGMTADAARDLERATSLAPRNARARYNLGLAYAQLGRLAEAVAALRAAESLAPDDVDATWARATVHARTGERALAVEAARRVLAVAPGHAGARALIDGSGSGR